MSSNNDDYSSDEDMPLPKRKSMLRHEIIIPSIETMDSDEFIEIEPQENNGEQANKTTSYNPPEDRMRLIKERMNDRAPRSNSFSDSRENKVDRHLTHTNSVGQFGRPLKTVYVPENMNKLPKAAPKNQIPATLAASSNTPIVSRTVTSQVAPVLVKEPSKRIPEENLEKCKETDPLFAVEPLNTWKIMKEALNFIIPHSSVPFKFWKMFINFMHLFNLVMAPVLFAWYIHFMSIGWVAIFLCLDILFLVDCYLRAHTSFIDEYGIHITNVNATIKLYLFTKLGWIDVISSLPLDLFLFTTSWEYYHMRLIL